MDRRKFIGSAAAAMLLSQEMPAAFAQGRKKSVMLMNRIGPSSSDLYIANADGSNERKFLSTPGFDYHASFSADGKWVLFTSERNGLGQSDVFRAKADGTDIKPLVTGPSVDDQAELSPDGTRLAFMSTRDGYRANVWVMDIKSGKMTNLTGNNNVPGRIVSSDPPGRPTASGSPSPPTATAIGAATMAVTAGSTRRN